MIIRKAVKIVRPSARRDVQRLVSHLVRRSLSRRLLNSVYDRFSTSQKESFYWFFSKLFRDSAQSFDASHWQVSFAGRRIVMPLTGEETWLEWDAAVSLLGHDSEIKRTYELLIRSERRPRLFFDIGANYGLHSLLFLAHGIETVSFEPNRNCHPYFRRIADLNNVSCNIQPVAIGSKEGSLPLWFPEKDTWFGTTDPATRDRLLAGSSLDRVEVQQTTLDRFVAGYGRGPQLIKIDTEGNELRVLQGGVNTLGAYRPAVIFESWPGDDRDALLKIFDEMDYRISALPLRRQSKSLRRSRDEFLESPASNFMALPAGERV